MEVVISSREGGASLDKAGAGEWLAITGTALSTGDSCSLVWSAAVQRRVCLDAAFPQLDVAFGGPVTAPGYDFHALRGRAGISQRIEWQRTVARIPVSLGRFGRSSVRLALAPWVQLTALDGRPDDNQSRGVYPSVGVGAVSLFDMLRVDVGRGLRNGRWTFALDVTRATPAERLEDERRHDIRRHRRCRIDPEEDHEHRGHQRSTTHAGEADDEADDEAGKGKSEVDVHEYSCGDGSAERRSNFVY